MPERVWRERNPPTLVGRNEIDIATIENSVEIP